MKKMDNNELYKLYDEPDIVKVKKKMIILR